MYCHNPSSWVHLRQYMVLKVVWIVKDGEEHVLHMWHLEGLIRISCFRAEVRVKCSVSRCKVRWGLYAPRTTHLRIRRNLSPECVKATDCSPLSISPTATCRGRSTDNRPCFSMISTAALQLNVWSGIQHLDMSNWLCNGQYKRSSEFLSE